MSSGSDIKMQSSKINSQKSLDNPRVVPMRLQRFLARAGVASRRGSEKLMSAGRVCVNGKRAFEMGTKVDPAVDVISVDGKVCTLGNSSVYLMLNKPALCLTTMYDPRGRKTVADLVPHDLYPGLFPVGRLDWDTTGLLLFTTDGDLSHFLLHPSHHVNKRYIALVQGHLSCAEIKRLERGIELSDGITAPAKAEIVDQNANGSWDFMKKSLPQNSSFVRLSIHEGRKNQVKRMFSALGHEVLRLHRESFGALSLSGVKLGSWRMLTQKEVDLLKSSSGFLLLTQRQQKKKK